MKQFQLMVIYLYNIIIFYKLLFFNFLKIEIGSVLKSMGINPCVSANIFFYYLHNLSFNNIPFC